MLYFLLGGDRFFGKLLSGLNLSPIHNLLNNGGLEKMPIKKSAWKELRKSAKKHQRNIAVKSELKTLVKKTEGLIASGKKQEAETFYRLLSSKFDKAASCKIIHKNTASRKKARLAKRLKKLS